MFAVLRTQKLKSEEHINNVHAHNTRTYTPPNVAIAPKMANKFHGTRESYWDAIQERFEAAGVKPRPNAVLAMEVVLSASPEHFRPEYDRNDPNGFHQFDEKITMKFAKDAGRWLKEKFGEENLISLELHLDEKTPHIHAVITPIHEKDMKKRRTKEQIRNNEKAETYKALRLDADTMFGPAVYSTIQEEFAKAVGLKAGFKKSETGIKHTSQSEYYRNLGRAMVREKRDIDIPELPKIRDKKFFESQDDYKKYITDEYDDVLVEYNRKVRDQLLKEEEHRRILIERTRELERLDKLNRQRLGALADVNISPDKIKELAESQEKRIAEEKAQRIANRKGLKVKGQNNPDTPHQ